MTQFINGLEVANLAVCSDLPLKAWEAISDIPPIDDPHSPLSVNFRISQIPGSRTKIIAFGPTSTAAPPSSSRRYYYYYLKGRKGRALGCVSLAALVSSFFAFSLVVSAVALLSGSFLFTLIITKFRQLSQTATKKLIDPTNGTTLVHSPAFEFLCTKKHPSISIRKAAVDEFVLLLNQLSAIRDQIDVQSPLIITGHSLGGSVASLFTLWLLDSIYVKTSKRPICITFGSPLLGDDAFEQAISAHPTWISCFLHVISNHDPIPTTNLVTPLPTTTTTTQITSRGFMPFGTNLFLSDSGSACFEEPGSVLELIMEMSRGYLSSETNIDYGEILKKLKYKAIKGEHEEAGEPDVNTLREGITLQIQAALGAIQGNTDQMVAFISKIEKRITKLLNQKSRAFDYTKKLNENKIYMAYIEWYKKSAVEDGGYCDHYKNAGHRSGQEMKSREEVVKYQRFLTQYWKKLVDEIDKMPKREGENAVCSRWLYGGMNYRRMVEPLDIAEYYKKGKRGYLVSEKGRSPHYKKLEEWQRSDKPSERKKPSSMTEDSCFWAHVEEAILSCQVLKDGESSLEDKQSSTRKLIAFEHYALDLIRKFAVSIEIFLEGSSFMKWWKVYEDIKGTSYESEFTAFMKNKKQENGSIVLDEYV